VQSTHICADLDRCGEIDAVELCQHIFPVFVPAYVVRAYADNGSNSATATATTVTTTAVPVS
jgi:hypothetical protein